MLIVDLLNLTGENARIHMNSKTQLHPRRSRTIATFLHSTIKHKCIHVVLEPSLPFSIPQSIVCSPKSREPCLRCAAPGIRSPRRGEPFQSPIPAPKTYPSEGGEEEKAHLNQDGKATGNPPALRRGEDDVRVGAPRAS
jgi:hypothetical protein